MRRLLVALLVGLLGAVGSSTSNTTTSTPSPREHRAEASSKELVTKIVKKIKTMAEHHKLPTWLQDQIYPEDNLISVHPDHYLIKPTEPTLDSAIYSSTGYHMKGMLGFVEYLILLILLKGSIDHVAARFKASLKQKEPLVRKTRDLRALAKEPLIELSHKVLRNLH